ncbi:MAG: hypothetical protein WC742_12425 [Gallionellaceae bacterium]|jgi:hypothetical protein
MNKRLINPLYFLSQHARLDDDQTRDLGIAYRVSLQALLTGHGSEQAWSTLACTLNVAMILCEIGIAAPALQTVLLAQEAMLRSRERAERTGKWALDGEGIRILQAALNIHDEQISFCTRQQITAALEEVHRRVSVGEAA